MRCSVSEMTKNGEGNLTSGKTTKSPKLKPLKWCAGFFHSNFELR